MKMEAVDAGPRTSSSMFKHEFLFYLHDVYLYSKDNKENDFNKLYVH